ncbi:MAG: regulatory signaling modulator protein AmpE [Oceanococcus sp.]
MTLITIVIAMLLERVLSYSPRWRAHNLTGVWMAWVDVRMVPRIWSLAIYLLVPIALVAALQAFFLHQPGGVLLMLPLSLLVLLGCLGPRDLAMEIKRYEKALEEGRSEVAESIKAELITGPGRSVTANEGRSMVAACFVQGHERWLSILLWFFVLGLPGAVAYRLLSAISCHLRHSGRDDELQKLTETLHGAMAWPSAHIAVVLYALAGSTDHAWERWRQWLVEGSSPWVRNAWPLLADIGMAALAQDAEQPTQAGECLDRAIKLLNRSMMIYLAVIALLTIGGWIA